MLQAESTIVELRNYTLQPGRRDDLIELFEREFIEPQEALGIDLPGLFRDVDRPDRFIWFRAFGGMTERKAALSAFYGGAVWRRHRDAANATMIDSDDVLLLRPARTPGRHGSLRGPLFYAAYALADDAALRTFANDFAALIEPEIRRQGGRVLATFVTEPSVNTFPVLPVREGEHWFVALVDGAERETIVASRPSAIAELAPTARSRMQLRHRGSRGDFDFLAGQWLVRHRKLRERLRGCSQWDAYDGRATAYSLLDGLLSVDEIVTGPGSMGCSIRNLDLTRGQWSIRWATSRGNATANPVRGGFEHARGDFYGTDTCNGVPVLVRYVWSACDGPAPQWEQAFSADDGATWETNWIMEFRRA